MNTLLKQIIAFLILASCWCHASAQQRSYRLPQGVGSDGYQPRTIIVKVKSKTSSSFHKKSVVQRKSAIPHTAKKASANHPLSNIYKITIDHDDVMGEINKLLEDENVIYAEPLFYHRSLVVPNDPQANPTTGAQDYLAVINAYDAWSVEQGDSSVFIGILDSGVDINHEDLASQIAYNLDDPVNGIDDDNDGLIDNYMGWDMADNDNNPLADADPHGTRVTGLSSARVNNGLGIAGSGFNSKFLPIKIFTSNYNSFANGYEAIALAADLGCKVINLSWGSPNSFSQYGQDVINYAALEKDVVIVAAAGNTHRLLNFYPASYDHVLSVGATNLDDTEARFTTFGYHVDMVAPGVGIYTTSNDNAYVPSIQGTSLSAPLVAGAAALVRARFKHLNALQVIEKLRVTSDDIYDIASNEDHLGLLGKGRLNMLEALTNNVSPALRISSMDYTNSLGEYVYANDTIDVTLNIINYLTALAVGSATISSNSPYVTITNSTMTFENVGTLQTVSNQSTPFSFITSPDLPPEEDIVFRVDFASGLYHDFQYFIITSSPNYANVAGGNLSMTVGGDGDLGYDEQVFRDGIGAVYSNENILNSLGLIINMGEGLVVDNAPNNLGRGLYDRDFELVQPQKRFSNGTTPVDIRSSFEVTDIMLVEQKTIATEENDFIIQEYRLTNTGAETYHDLSLSIFANWDIGNKNFNKANWDGDIKLGYIHDGEVFAGIALLTGQDSLYSAVNNINFNGNTADLPVLLNDSVKYSHTSRGIFKTVAGDANDGNDVSHFIGAEIDEINMNESTKVTFVFVVGKSLAVLRDKVRIAKETYAHYQTNPPLIHVSRACPGQPAVVNPGEGINYDFYADVDMENLLFSGEAYVTEPISNFTTYYVVNKDEDFDSDIFTVSVQPSPVNTHFSTDADRLLFDETGNTSLHFYDESVNAISWYWDFDNGFTSTMQNPLMNFTEAGNYHVSLTAINDIGCEETITQLLEVAYRSLLPNINDVQVCRNEELLLDADNATNLEFYTDEGLTNLLYRGESLIASFEKDTIIYVVSTDSAYRSNVKPVEIKVDNVRANFEFVPDTLDTSSKTLVKFNSTSDNDVLTLWYINDLLVSTDHDFTYDYSGQESLEIKLVAESISSCQDVMIEEIIPAQGSIPTVENYLTCPGENVTIEPEGDFLHFYSDETLTTLIGKGSFVELSVLNSDTSIYVTNNAKLLESSPAKVFIDVSDIEAAINPTVTTLNLAEDSEVVFLDASKAAVAWSWMVNGDTISTEKNAVIKFTDVGTFDVGLMVSDEAGCRDVTSMPFEVINITSTNEASSIIAYPNPTASQISFTMPLKDITIFTNTGQSLQVIEGVHEKLSLEYLPKGSYLIKGISGHTVHTFYVSVR